MNLETIMDITRLLSNPLVFLVIMVVIILIIRELVLWYLRINHIINRQDKQIELLQDLIDVMHKK